MNIFEILNKNNTPYSVVRSTESLISAKKDFKTTSYYIIIAIKDIGKISSFFYYYIPRSENHNIAYIDLDKTQINNFNNIKQQFKIVQSDNDGTIFELKNNSFKKYYKSNY